MKKLVCDFFDLPNNLREAFEQLRFFYPIEAGKGSRVNLKFQKIGENEISSCRKDGKVWVVSYSKMKYAGRGLLYAFAEKEGEIKSDFDSAGLWFDVSRNAVMKVDFIKERLAQSFLLGCDCACFYVEDVYELVNEP